MQDWIFYYNEFKRIHPCFHQYDDHRLALHMSFFVFFLTLLFVFTNDDCSELSNIEKVLYSIFWPFFWGMFVYVMFFRTKTGKFSPDEMLPVVMLSIFIASCIL